MKKFKLFLMLILIPVVLHSQDLIGNLEFAIQNNTGEELEIQLYPISGCFNGNSKYTFIAANQSLEPGSNTTYFYNYINGTCYQMDENGIRELKVKHRIPTNNYFSGWNIDWGPNENSFGNIIYGNYKLIIKNLGTERIDSCLINLDYYSQSNTPGDLYFYIYPDGSQKRFCYRFDRTDQTNVDVNINYSSNDYYTAKSWQPNGPNNTINARGKNFGNFELINVPPDNNDNFPLDSRKDCNIFYPQQGFHFSQSQVYPETGFDERHGIIPLNLTIKKKVSTPYYQTQGCSANLEISIEPSVMLSIDKGLSDNPNQIYYGFFMNQYGNTTNGNDLILKSSISLNPDSLTTLNLVSGSTYEENSRIYVRNNCKIISENRSKIVFGDYSQIFLERISSQSSTINPKLILRNNSNINFGFNSEINVNAYGELINEGGLISYSQNSNAKINIQSNGLYEIKPNVTNIHIVNNGGRIIVQGGQLKIGDNSSLVFDGSTSYLQVDAGSSISLGQNAKIEFKNGAYMIANGGTISSLNASTPGKGLVFENSSAQTSISNMTFNNLTNSIYIYNTTAGYSGMFKNISNNTFNGNEFCNYVIETKNANNLTIAYNQIYMQPSKGIGVLIRYPSNLGDGMAAAVPYTVNIYNNTIANGNISTAFVCLTNSYAGVNFKYNNCYGSVSHGNINMRQITGDIKYNTLNSVSGKTLEINQSVPNVYSNTMYSSNLSVYNYSSYPKFAPVPDEIGDGGWIWLGGKNNITSSNNDNIYYSDGNVLLDWGQNCFNRGGNNFHLHGNINEPTLTYLVRNNGFNSNNSPSSQLFDISTGLVVNPYWIGSNFTCNNSTDAGTIWLINDLGNGVYDTLYKTSNTSGYQPPQDEVLYSTAIVKRTQNDNFGAVSYFKSLITGFPNSSYTEACLYSLYECYEKLDTSSNQGMRDILYTDLKNYLDGKILSGLYSDEFNYTAYNITMMCLASIAEYNEAMTGYEFIALYHPDAYIRLLASWDYAEIELLLNGSGGISSKEENLTDAEYFAKLTKHVNKGINEDPIKKKVKKSFDKVKDAKTDKAEKEALAKTNDVKLAKLEVAKMKQKDEVMNTKARNVLRFTKTLTREEKDKRQIEDILFSRSTENSTIQNSDRTTPEKFELSQNFPNPFNPMTKINFALPKQGFVSLKIYDITGREIQTLVSEVKQAGYYSVDFNGSALSSGVYFYMIKSGDFVMTKRMVLIK